MPLVENGPGPATILSQTGRQASEAQYTEDAESPYGYDTPCDVNSNKVDDVGHYEDYDNELPNVGENNGNTMTVNSEVTPDYTYDTPCEVKKDSTDANIFWYHTRNKQVTNAICMTFYCC